MASLQTSYSSQDKRNFEKWILEGVMSRKYSFVSLPFIEYFLKDKHGATVGKEVVREMLQRLEISGKLLKIGSMYTVKLMSPTFLGRLNDRREEMKSVVKKRKIPDKLLKIGSIHACSSQEKITCEKWILEGVTSRKGSFVSLAFIEHFLKDKHGAIVGKGVVREVLQRLEISGKLLKIGSMYTVKLMSPTLLGRLKDRREEMKDGVQVNEKLKKSPQESSNSSK